jgi:molecular chaperone GrpE (heat shock protein)
MSNKLVYSDAIEKAFEYIATVSKRNADSMRRGGKITRKFLKEVSEKFGVQASTIVRIGSYIVTE